MGLAAVLVVAALATSACGGHAGEATDEPGSGFPATASTTATPTPTVGASATAGAEPLSPLENRAPVKAARAFMVQVARAVNAGDTSMRSVSGLSTAAGVRNAAAAEDSDLRHRAVLPGPQPFTPVAVRLRRGEADVVTCMKNHGWALDRKTRRPYEKRTVAPVILTMRLVGGRWKFDRTSSGAADCSGVRIREVRW